MHLSVVVPCFNEEGNIGDVVRQAARVGRGLASELEIIVVDDGSTDATPAVLAELQLEIPELKTVLLPRNRGYGAAVRAGLARSKLDYVFLTDGDGQFDLTELTRAIELLENHDVVAGYRRSRRDGWWRDLWGRCWTKLVNVAFDLEVRDANCAFKLIPQRLIGLTELTSNGAMISAELLFEARRAGMRVGELPVTHYPRGEGDQSGASIRVIALAFVELAASVVRRGRTDLSGQARATTVD